jgi:hypothetical protein
MNVISENDMKTSLIRTNSENSEENSDKCKPESARTKSRKNKYCNIKSD